MRLFCEVIGSLVFLLGSEVRVNNLKTSKPQNLKTL